MFNITSLWLETFNHCFRSFWVVKAIYTDRNNCQKIIGKIHFVMNWLIWSVSAPWKKSSKQPKQHTKKHRHYFAAKGPSSPSYGFSSSHVWMWELDYKESWAPKNWCFSTVVLENTLESPLACKEIKPVNHKGNQSWIFTGRSDAEAETPILWPPDAKNWLIRKDTDAGQDWMQENVVT